MPYAKQYVLMPVEDPSSAVFIGDSRTCGDVGSTLTFSQLLMDEIARVMTDDDIVGIAGVSGERCLIVVKLSKEHCYKVLDGGLISVINLFEEHPQLVPVGWRDGFQLRDWDDIPDEEKAGYKK